MWVDEVPVCATLLEPASSMPMPSMPMPSMPLRPGAARLCAVALLLPAAVELGSAEGRMLPGSIPAIVRTRAVARLAELHELKHGGLSGD